MNARHPLSESEMFSIIASELRGCGPEELKLFNEIRIPPLTISFDRGTFAENVFAIAAIGRRLIYYDDIEEKFEVGLPDPEGVLRTTGCGQFSLCQALAQIRIGSR